MRRILVPTDFSNNAFKAIAYAAEILKVTGGTMHLLHVIEPTLNMATMQTDSLSSKKIKAGTEKLQITLKSVQAVYPDIRIRPFLAGGKVSESIIEYAEKRKIRFIVMGTCGAGGLKKLFMGSVASATVAESKIPVLTVPAAFEVRPPKNVLFATNRFEKKSRVLKNITRLQNLFDAQTHVVIFKEKKGDKHADYIYNHDQLNTYLGFLQEKFPELSFKGALIEGEEFDESIEDYCDKNECDLMVMVPYPKTFFERFFQKSETKKMVHQSTVPILAVPAITNNPKTSNL